jgi:hypothetical protein
MAMTLAELRVMAQRYQVENAETAPKRALVAWINQARAERK